MSVKHGIKILYGAGNIGTGTTGGAQCLGDKQIIQSLLDSFKKHGHNQIDSARLYGQGTSEQLLGELNYAEQGFVLDTKINSFYAGAHKRENFNSSLQQSLTALKTNKVNLLYLHVPDRTVPLDETMETVNEAYKQGHFEHFGVSNLSPAEVEEIIKISTEKGYVKPVVYQGLYNLVSRTPETDLFPVLRKHSISFYAYSPLAGSFLTGEMSKDHQPAALSRFDPNIGLGQAYRGRYFKDSYFEALEKLKEVAAKHNITVQEIALRWIVHHSQLKAQYGDGVVIGGTKLVNVERTLDALEKPPLPADVLQVVEDIWTSIKDAAPPSHR